MTRRWTIALAVLGLAGLLVALWVVRRPREAAGILETSGRIEGDQAAVAAKVGGKLARLVVREGDRVEAAGVIAELTAEQARARLEQAEHGLHTAREQLAEARARVRSAGRQVEGAEIAVTLAERESRARVGEAEAALGAAKARLREAEAEAERAAKDHARYRQLFDERLIAAQQLDQSKAADAATRAGVEAARQQVTQAEEALALARASRVATEVRRKEAETAAERSREARAAVETAGARVESAEASRKLAEADLTDTRVVAPFAGTVLRKLVEVGEVVAPGTPLVTLVDLARLHAKVYVAEADIGKVKVGDPARVYTDAFPRRYFEAAVSEVSQQAEFTPRDVHMKDERVRQVFAVKLAIANAAGVLKPGMPVDARVRWSPEAPWGDRPE